jgi:hypothetical protein
MTAGHPHKLNFSVTAEDWADAERQAVQVICTYTKQSTRGRGKETPSQILRDAVFDAVRLVDGFWHVNVEVIV